MYSVLCIYKYYSEEGFIGFRGLMEGLMVPKTAKNPHEKSNLFSTERSDGAVLRMLIGSCHFSALKPLRVLGIKCKLLTLALKGSR